MLTSKQRARLRGIASKEDTIFQLGKDGITENFIKAVDNALTARELIKFRILESSFMTPKDAAYEVANEVGAEVVTVIGSKAVLYRMSDDNIFEL